MSTVRITIKTPDNINFNSWEISNYLNRIASYHYKYEALGELLRMISTSESIANIFVLSESFLIDRPYKFLSKVFLTDKSLISLLNIGKIVPLIPNKLFAQINFSYDLLSLSHSLLEKQDSKVEKRSDYIFKQFNELIGNEFERKYKNKIEKIIASAKKKERTKVEGKINNLVKTYNSTSFFNLNQIERIDNETVENLTKNFRKRVSYLQRPVLGILTKENQFIIAATDLIQNKENSLSYFIIRDFYKENPVTINIDVFGDILEKILYPAKAKLEEELLQTDIDLQKQKVLKEKIENYGRVLELHEKFYSNLNNRTKGANSYLEVQLQTLLSEIQGDMAKKSIRVSRGEEAEIKSVDILA